MKPKVVILTTNFGNNFSGGALVTCEIFERLQNEFETITVIGTQVGQHSIQNLKFIQCNTWLATFRTIDQLKSETDWFYGDFYNSFLLAMSGVKYIFTYHDNWPELANLNLNHQFQNLFYSATYQYIFRKVHSLISVSSSRKLLNQRNFHHIPNGFKASKKSHLSKTQKVLMVGNIDARKYLMATKLFNLISPEDDIRIDIYGHVVSEKVANRLSQFPFVKFCGFADHVPYASYKVLLHTSYFESFGMVYCEAIDAGTPVVTFDYGEARNIVGSNGILIDPYDLKEMKKALLGLLDNPIVVDAASVQQYSWESTASQYLKLFQNAG